MLSKNPVIAAMVLAIFMFMFPAPAMAQERIPEHTLMVQGVGTVSAQPDSVNLTVGVETQAPTVEAARNQNSQKATAILQRLKGLGIPRLVLQTAFFTVNPVREAEIAPMPPAPRRPYKTVGYMAQHQIQAKIEGGDPNRIAEYASQIIDTALAAGANHVNGPTFYLSQGNPAQREALKLAVQQARQHATAIAEAVGVRLSGIYNIEAMSMPMPMRYGMAEAAMMSRDAAPVPTPIESGRFDVTTNVVVRFQFQQ